ncbi:sugar phosphate isomerase/epimerase [Arthrobacter sp. STN4]|uniref:sugar phosphate isomerase/epimerase family protein n=1 Tax=Arthrobacter sp. STN4 TaxID=2923276 RepID=UPI002119B959|nr:TIM barrel protein [Arthrobacter sp. STN4]MCQ9165429.1 sugar phosphate isomerase/epimerase [Arthrobacter sp. STN4]
MTELGIAHLSLLQLDPAELVHVAAEAGFQFVGLRVRGATPSEAWPDQRPGSPASRATVAALQASGLRVRDIEFLSLDGRTGREAWMPMLEAGAALGADTLNLAGQDPDVSRLTDTLAQLVSDAAGYGIVPALEPISYNVVSSVPQAAPIARAAGARVMLDPLHLQRGGSSHGDVAALDPSLIPVLQLCDGPAAVPEQITVPTPLPRGMSALGGPRQVESRALRLAPGEGAFDLVSLLRAVPAGVPLSLEVPNNGLVSRMGAVGYARYLREATLSLLERMAPIEPADTVDSMAAGRSHGH